MNSASNSLAREFLIDVNRLCSAVVQRQETREEEDESHMAGLGQYLVKGRGFTLLNTLNGIIDQELTCREELLTLLLSLLPLVWKIPVQEEKAEDFICVSSLVTTWEKTVTEGSPTALAQNPLKKRCLKKKTGQPHRASNLYSVKNAMNSHLSTTDSDASSDETNALMMKEKCLPSIVLCDPKECLASFGVEPQTEMEKSLPSSNINLENVNRNIPGFNFGTSSDLSLLNTMDNSPFDLCHVLLSLLEKVCIIDLNLNRNSPLVASVVPTLTDFLSGFRSGYNISDFTEAEMVSAGWTEEPIALVQRMIFRTVLHILSVNIMSLQTMPDDLRNNMTNLVTSTLKIKACLEKQSYPFAARHRKISEGSKQNFTVSKCRHTCLLLSELLEGILQILFCCLQTASSNSFYFSQAIDLVHEFIQLRGFELFETAVLQMEWLSAKDEDLFIQPSEHVKYLISSIIKIIGTIKKVKAEQLHQTMCTRRRHRRCEYSHFLHHHRDISGLPLSAFRNLAFNNSFDEIGNGDLCYPDRCCCIAVCAQQCLRLLQHVSLTSTYMQLLAGIQDVGICCCMDPKTVIAPLLHVFQLPILKNVQKRIVDILNKFLLDQLGGGEVSTKIKPATCNICTIDTDQLDEFEDFHETIRDDEPAARCSSHRFQGILPNSGPGDIFLKWNALQSYQAVVFGEDNQLSEQISSHICHLVLKGNSLFQWKLYIYIFKPVLQSAVELVHHSQLLNVNMSCENVCRYHNKCLPPEVLQTYLQVLPTLLQIRVIRDLFLNYNGVNQMTELNYLDSLRDHSLKVFESLILCLGECAEQNEDTEQESLLNHTADNQKTSSETQESLISFYASLKEDYAKKKKHTNQEVQVHVINIFLCVAFLCVSKEADFDGDAAHDSEDTSGYDSTASDHLSHKLPHLSLESLMLPSQEQIRRAVDIWAVCQRMYLLSAVFQKQFHRLGGVDICHRLIFMIIEQLASPRENHSEKRPPLVIEKKRLHEKSCSESVLNTSTYDLKNEDLLQSNGLSGSDPTTAKSEQLDLFSSSSSHLSAVERFSMDESEPQKNDSTLKMEADGSLQSIRLLESLLAIGLHSANTNQQKVAAERSLQTFSVEHILHEIHEALSKSGIVQTNLAKPLFGSLFRIALANNWDDFRCPGQRIEKVYQTEEETVSRSVDLSEEADESLCYDLNASADEEGYDADSESNPDDCLTNVEGSEKISQTGCNVHSDYITAAEHSKSHCILIFPEICILVLNLLSANEPDVDVLELVFYRLLEIIRYKERNAMLLIHQGAVKIILSGFRYIFSKTDPSFKECQHFLTDLLVLLMSSGTCSEELTLLMRLFLEKDPVIELLLKGILKMVETNDNMSPTHHFTFPLQQNPGVASVSGQKTANSLGIKSMFFLRKTKLSQNKKDGSSESFSRHQVSSWHVAPIHLPLVGQNCWPHMSEGFSVALWLKIDCFDEDERAVERGKKIHIRKQPLFSSNVDYTGEDKHAIETPNCGGTLGKDGSLHLISLGSKALMLQVWADLNTRSLILRMCIDSNDDVNVCVLAQATSPGDLFLPDKWQLLTFTYVHNLEGKKNMHGKLSLWVSGERKPDISLYYALPRRGLQSDSNKTFCMIGHSTSSQEELLQLPGRWHLGNLLLFNGATIGSEEAFYLYTCGAACTSIVSCKYGKPKNNYSKYINKDILQNEQIKELFMKPKEVDVGPLMENLALLYTPGCPAQYTIYEPVLKLKGLVKTVPSQRPFTVKAALSNFPDSHLLENLHAVQHRGLQSVLHEIGGCGAFVFLFARVVDISNSEEPQALALQVILSSIKYNQQRMQEMENCDGYLIIRQLLIKPKCIVGFHILKTILLGCCDEEIIHITESGQFRLQMDSTAVIQDIKLLEELLLDWKIWSKAQQGVWEALLASLEILIRSDHPQQMFNIKQLLQAQIVHHFLLTCQVLQEHRDVDLVSIPKNVCLSYVKIIEEVLGCPPDLELLKLIFNFLLAVHPPTHTYVCHNPNNFFCSLHAGGTLCEEKIQTIMYERWKKVIMFGARPEFAIPSPADLSCVLPEGTKSSLLNSQGFCLTAYQRQRSSSLPIFPVSSLQVHSRRARLRMSRSAEDIQNVSNTSIVSIHEDNHNAERPETLQKMNEEIFSNICQSTETVCPSQKNTHPKVVVDSKEQLERLLLPVKNMKAEPEQSSFDESASDELPLLHSGYLKGTYSFSSSKSNFASMGSTFHAQGGPSTNVCSQSIAYQKAVFQQSSSSGKKACTLVSPDRSTEESSILICCGLYDLLRGALLILPDLMLGDVMDKLIQPDILITLVNHPSSAIQEGVLKLLDAYFQRSSKEQKEAFLKKHGFTLLANQLYLHPGTRALINCFLEMLFGRPFGLDEEVDVEELKNTSLFRKWCVTPILGFIENSLYDSTLLHSLFVFLLQIFNSCSKVADMLLENGLVYVLCNTIAALNGLVKSMSLNEYKLLMCDIQQLLVTVTIHSCSSSGSQCFRVVEDLILLLGYLQNSNNKTTQYSAVALQFKVLKSAVEFIKTTVNQNSQSFTSSFHLPATHHHAIYQKRKSIAVAQRFSLAQPDALLMRMRSVANDELATMMHRKMSQEDRMRVTESEFVQRLQRLTVLAVNRLIYLDYSHDCLAMLSLPETTLHFLLSPSEDSSYQELSGIRLGFQNEMLKMMIDGIRSSFGEGINVSRKQWKAMLWACKNIFRMQLGRLLVYVLSPTRTLQERKHVFKVLHEPNLQEIIRDCLSPPLQHGPKLALYLYELIHEHKEELTSEELSTARLFMKELALAGYKYIPPSAPSKPSLVNAIKEEQKKYDTEETEGKTAWYKAMSNNQLNLFQSLDAKTKEISKIAGEITQAVCLSQGLERKKVIQHIRGMYKVDLSSSRHWQELVHQLTHERALWYDLEAYPTSWQLDPTEGPNRERRRLQRCYLRIPSKYILRERCKPKEDVIRPPLSYLNEDNTNGLFSSTVKDKAASELIRVNRRCICVAPSKETSGELLLGKTGMYFVEDNSEKLENSSHYDDTDPVSFSWTYEEIKEVHTRWWQLRDNAVEIFLTNGCTFLLAFDNTKVRDALYQDILVNDLPNLLEYGNLAALTQLWCTGQITNFEYLTHLNKHSGRSFNDLMQYPVFPFILADYTSESLDMSNPAVFRNLAKPIAVQSKEKEDRYINNYKYLEEEYLKGAKDDEPMPPVQPYHYGSHYSNSGTVLHFLVRLPPFTKMFLVYQDQSFDIPDRTFHSMDTTWRLSSYESMTDVKELIPEFFYLPEFLVNREGFDFGIRQNGERVNHVNLPPWARNDPRLFILIHRQALESDYVSQTMCHWIDLVFGYKQKGRAAVQSINVFHPATYFGMDVTAVDDPVQRRALETMIKTYGQTPRQLFHTPHVSRPVSKPNAEVELPAAMGLLVQLAFGETKEHTKEVLYQSPLSWIRGLKWGEYVGSPSAPDPVVCFSQPHGEQFGFLQALPTKAICGLSPEFCLMVIYSKEQGVRSMTSTDIQWSAILSWGYMDNILRLKSKQSEPPVNFIQCSPFHQVTCCAWVPESSQLFTGSKCGVITAYLNRFTNNMPPEIEVESQLHLYGHTAEITSLIVCKPYSVMISVSRDGTCIIWDLNRLCYVQSLTGHKSPVTAASVSETTGDIATVCDSVGGGSDLRLWTVNGDLVGHVHCREIICSVSFSNQPEGLSVNVIAGGLQNGVVRLWSTWDLKPVREITFPKSNKPIISLTFSCDGHHLYTSNSDGTVIAWCRKDQQRLKLPMFYSFLRSYAVC
ncbi:lysosomal-trafficking regulator isoform X2 [Lissotriton helveticus]